MTATALDRAFGLDQGLVDTKVCAIDAVWSDARADCLSRDGDLFAFWLYKELDRVLIELAVPDQELWLGLHAKRAGDRVDRWISGERLPLPAPPWVTDTATVGPACGAQRPIDQKHPTAYVPFEWRLVDCQRKLPYLCRQVPWTRRTSTGHAYKVYHQGLMWDDARDACAKLGAHLVTITDQDEAAFVSRLLDGQDAWIGATDRAREGTFAWVTGESLTYREFAPLQPDDPQGMVDCLAISTGGGWYDRDCEQPYVHVCERD